MKNAVLAIGATIVVAGCSAANTPSIAPAPALRAVHYALPLAGERATPAVNDFVTYKGGPVLVTPTIYLIFWGYQKDGDPDGVAKLLTSYTQSIGGSPHDNIYTQYYQIVDSLKSFITNPKKQYGGVWNDNSAVPKSPSDEEIGEEALKSLSHFKYDSNGLYVVATPHGHSEAGFPSSWCSYHSYTYYHKTLLLPYANMPYMPDGGKICGENFIKPPADEPGTDEGVTILAGHEYGEAITDPEPFTGWNGVSGEIGDYCAWHGIKNIAFGSKSYTTQPMLSDKTESCVQTYK
jgi:hypothetical protein